MLRLDDGHGSRIVQITPYLGVEPFPLKVHAVLFLDEQALLQEQEQSLAAGHQQVAALDQFLLGRLLLLLLHQGRTVRALVLEEAAAGAESVYGLLLDVHQVLALLLRVGLRQVVLLLLLRLALL